MPATDEIHGAAVAHREERGQINERRGGNLRESEAHELERRSEQEHRHRDDRRDQPDGECRSFGDHLERKHRHDDDARGVPIHLAEARIPEQHVQRAGNPAIERLVPERHLSALQPEMLHEDAIRIALKLEVVVADAVQRPAAHLVQIRGREVGEPWHADQQERTASVSVGARATAINGESARTAAVYATPALGRERRERDGS